MLVGLLSPLEMNTFETWHFYLQKKKKKNGRGHLEKYDNMTQY